MMSKQGASDGGGGGAVMGSLKNVGDVSMAVTSIAMGATGQGQQTSKGGEKSKIDAPNNHTNEKDSNKDMAIVGIENTKNGKDDFSWKISENGKKISVANTKETEKKKEDNGKASLKHHNEDCIENRTEDKRVQKKSAEMIMKMVEIGGPDVAINQGLMKSKTSGQNTENIKNKDSEKAKGERFLDSRIHNIQSLTNTTGCMVREVTKETNIETTKEITNDKPRNYSKIEDESNIAVRVIESGKQLIDINNELTKQKTTNKNRATELSKKQQNVQNNTNELGIATKEVQKQAMIDEKYGFDKSSIKEDGLVNSKKDKMLNSMENKMVNIKEDKMINSKEGQNLEDKNDVQNDSKPEAYAKKDEQNVIPCPVPIQVSDSFWTVLDENRLRDKFQLFSMLGDRLSDGTTIKLSQSDKWFKEAGIMNRKGFSTTDTDIAFRKVSKKAQKVNFGDWVRYLDNLASAKNCNVNDIKNKLVECEGPASTGPTKSAVAQAKNLSVQSRSDKSNGKKTRTIKGCKKETGKVPWRY